MKTIQMIGATSIVSLAVGWFGASLVAQTSGPNASDVVSVKLPLDLPAIGNLDAATNWRFGRIESVVQIGAEADVKINIRTQGGEVIEVIGPRVLSKLARVSNWVSSETNKRQLTREDYVERMIAFDVDNTNRIIAMISMEPMDRDKRRLVRGL